MSDYTITNRYGFSLMTDVQTNVTLLTVSTTLDEAIVFSIIRRFEDYETASLAVLAMYEGGLRPHHFVREEQADDTTGQEDEGETTLSIGAVTATTA